MSQNPNNLPPEAQQMLQQLQQQQQTLQQLNNKKQQLEMQKNEVQKAIDELDKTEGEKKVFKVAGPVLIESNKDDLQDEMNEKKESIGIKLNSIDKKMSKTEESAIENQQKLQKMVAGGGSGDSTAAAE